MSTDGEECPATNYTPLPHDLEMIVTALQLGAIYLTDKPGTLFTFKQLYDQAREICGAEFDLDEKDVKIVLSTSSFLKKEKGGLYSLK